LGGGIFWEELCGKTFLEKKFGEDFLGGIFLGGIFWEQFFVYIVKVS
jgi:hypothetical protein